MITAGEVRRALSGDLSERDANDLAAGVRARLGSEALAQHTGQIVDELDVAWVVEGRADGSAPMVVAEVGEDVRRTMRPLGQSGLFVAAARWSHGTAVRWRYERDGKRLGGGQTETYLTHPDMRPHSGIQTGSLVAQPPWRSQVFAGTVRDWSIYLPPGDSQEPCCVMVFQDGVRSYQDFVPTAFDNLIACGDMPPTVGVFLNPGVFADTTVSNRSFEYDTLSNQYTQFLLDEILPAVAQQRSLRQDAASRAICGISSGGICAFTVAWQRPDQIHKVLSHVGSFTNIASGPSLREGGHNYPFLIRKAPHKPIRVYLQDGQNDLNNAHGSWWLANLQMVDALSFAGYDHTFASGRGFHALAHGRAIFPDSLRWLWRR